MASNQWSTTAELFGMSSREQSVCRTVRRRTGHRGHRLRGRPRRARWGSSTIDYFLLMAVILPLAAFLMQIAPRMMRSVYDLLTVVVAWPFL